MAFRPEEDLSCTICQEVFKDPVVLSCSHSFCKDCLRSWWREKPTQDCPVCKRRSSRSDPPRNLALKNLCEAYVQQREKNEERQKTSEEQVCQVHSEKLKLFCLSDQQPVCVVCRDSKVHEEHRFRPIAEAAQDLREELVKALLPLEEDLQKAKKYKRDFEEKADCIKKQFHQTERQIHDQFEKLHQFLVEEEESRMKALRKEEEQKTRTMKDKMAAVSREIEALSENIRATEEQLKAADISFLLKYKAAVERVQHCPLLEKRPQLGPEALIDRAKHLGNLTFNIWTNMKRLVHPPFILDLIKDQESMNDNFDIVFESEWVDSGFHKWEVEVGNSEKWGIGFMADPFEAGVKVANPEMWAIVFLVNTYAAVHSKVGIFVNLLKLESAKGSQRISVHLNFDNLKVSFYDAVTNTHIHTFTQISQKKLLLFFCRQSKCPVLKHNTFHDFAMGFTRSNIKKQRKCIDLKI